MSEHQTHAPVEPVDCQIDKAWPMYVAGEPRHAPAGAPTITVRDKHTGRPLATVPQASAAALDEALEAAHRARAAMAALPAYQRRDVLLALAAECEADRALLTALLVREAGKSLRFAAGEVQRCIDTLRLSAQAAMTLAGASVPLDHGPATASYRGFVRRAPVGVVAAICPFNFPLNLVAHKLGPAMAAGCPVVVKPAPRTPLSALALGAMLARAAADTLPAGAWSVVLPSDADAATLATDPRVAFLSFTGSERVGWMLRDLAARKRVALELGGDASVILAPDWTPERVGDERFGEALDRIVTGAFYQAGQSCISVQHVLVVGEGAQADRTWQRVCAGLTARAGALRGGDPWHPDTFLSPLIEPGAADRVESWLAEATAGGARLLAGGTRDDIAPGVATIDPTVVVDVPEGCRLAQDEVFGPVVCLWRSRDLDDAFARVNASRFGLQVGVLTDDRRTMTAAWDALQVGAVVVGDIPSFRVDAMPYGGVKASGLGREGPSYAAREMTEPRMLIVRDA